MTMNNLADLFYDVCSEVKNRNCVTYVHSTKLITVSYSDMKYQVDNFYNCLQKIMETKTNNFIGVVSNELNSEVIAIIIGILKSSNAFVYFDTTSNTNSTSVINKLDISYLIYKSDINEQSFPQISETTNVILTLNIFDSDFKICKLQNQNINTTSINNAFAVFSSGSTGSPKIIRVPHDCIIPNIIDLRKIYKLQSTDTIYISTPMTFDPCIMDIFLAFSCGASIFLTNNDIKFNHEYMLKFFSPLHYNVTVWYTTPSLFLKCFPRYTEKSSLRILTFGGESFPNLNLKIWPFLKNVQVYNIYGITEVSCWASICHVTNFKEMVSLGPPLSDTILEVRNDNDAVIYEGEGELYIGSEHRMTYVNDEISTSRYNPCFRATGDIVNITNGNYYFVGRKDRRIKLYGHQINLEVLEKKILGHTSIKCCCCIYVEKEEKIISFVELLVKSTSIQHIETFIKAQFPSFMSSDIHFIPQIPVNKHGKASEKSCKAIYFNLKKNKNIPTEFKNLWIKYTLQSLEKEIDEERGFIQSGGNSFTALQFTSALVDVGIVPNNFLAFLLSDRNYLDCFNLIKINLNQKLVKPSGFPDFHKFVVTKNAFMKNEEILDQKYSSDSFYNKLKTETALTPKITCVLCKGQILNLKTSKYSRKLLGFNEIKLKWKYDLKKCVDASPTIIVFNKDAFVVCGSHSGQVIVCDVESGKIVCSIELPDRIESSACVCSSGDSIFLGCYNGRLYCININDCCIKWYFQTQDIIKSTPVFYNNQIFFGSYDHNFYCLSSDNGSLSWKLQIDEFPIYATAVIKNYTVIICTLGGSIAFVELNGTLKNKTIFGQPFFSNPVTIPNKDLCIFIDVTGIIRLFDTNSFQQLWYYKVDGNVFSSISMLNSESTYIIFGCHDKNVYCFEISEKYGNLLWKTEINAPIYSTPFICENIIPSIEKYCNYTAVVASTAGFIFLLDALNGNILTNYSIGQDIFSSPVVFNSNILIGSRDNNLYCLSIS